MPDTTLPESTYRITSHEILALLAFQPGAGASLTRRVLGLAELPDDHDLVRAGVGTLNVRDSAAVEGEQVTLLGEANVLSRILSGATQWFDVTRIGAESASPSYVVESDAGRAAIFLRPLSEYVCVPLRQDLDVLDFIETTVEDAVGSFGASAGIVTSRRYRADGSVVVANIKVLDDGSRQLASLPLDTDGQLTVRPLAADERPGRLVRALLSDPA